jgi:hypothetical protein
MTKVSFAKEMLLEDIEDKTERFMLGRWKEMEAAITQNQQRLLKGAEKREDFDEEHDVFCGLKGYDRELVVKFCTSLREGITQEQEQDSAAASTNNAEECMSGLVDSLVDVRHKSGAEPIVKAHELHRVGKGGISQKLCMKNLASKIETSQKTGQNAKIPLQKQQSPFISMLKNSSRSGPGGAKPENEAAINRILQPVREIFLHVVKQSYWEQMEKHILPKRSVVCGMLLNSVYIAEDDTVTGLNDW